MRLCQLSVLIAEKLRKVFWLEDRIFSHDSSTRMLYPRSLVTSHGEHELLTSVDFGPVILQLYDQLIFLNLRLPYIEKCYKYLMMRLNNTWKCLIHRQYLWNIFPCPTYFLAHVICSYLRHLPTGLHEVWMCPNIYFFFWKEKHLLEMWLLHLDFLKNKQSVEVSILVSYSNPNFLSL